MTRHWAGCGWRAALFGAFAAYLYVAKYAPYRQQPYDEPLVTATVRASNAGYPFHVAFATGEGGALTMTRMSDYYADYGIHILLSLVGSIGRAISGPSFRIDTSMARTIVLAVCLVTAATMLLPPVPIEIGSAGVLSLWALFRWGTLALSEARFWGVGFVTVVVGVYVATAVKPWTRSRATVLIVLAALAGYGQLLRQEAGPATNVAGFALIAASPLIALAMRRQSADGVVSPNRRTLAARSLAAGVLLIAANGSILPLERWCFSRAWGTPFSQTSFAVHGSGWPLYLSLGYVSNPFNIGWRDPIGQVHAHLINPAIRVDSDPAFQRTLLSEYERIVVSEPWLLLRNVRAKAARVDELAGHRSGANTGTAVAQPLALVVMYRAVPIALVATLVLLAWRGTVDAVVVWFSCCALALGASAGPVLVFPEYLGGVQGATVVLLSIVPAAVIGSIAFGAYGGNDSQAARRLIQMYGAAIAVGVAIGAVFVLVQRWRYDARLAETAAAKPLDALRVEEFRYAHLFNDLPVARQGRLVAQLQASADPNISHAIDERKGDFELFAPQVLVRTQSQIHLFVWMGRGFVPPLPRLFQGSTHASLMICGSCAAAASINDVQLPMRWTMINDLEWQGRYRMFSFSNSPTLQKTPFFRVIAERTRALDMQLPMWIVPELISSARLTF